MIGVLQIIESVLIFLVVVMGFLHCIFIYLYIFLVLSCISTPCV